MTETPCQKCKRERDELAARVVELEAQLDKAMALLGEAGAALAEGAKALRGVIAERAKACQTGR